MTTQHLTVRQLQETDPKRFQKEYWKWVNHTHSYDWWDSVEELFTADCAELDVTVDSISFRASCSQGDGACFTGRVELPALMRHTGLDVEYPALYLGICNDGSYARIRNRSNHSYSVGVTYECYAAQTAPDGVFKDLSQEDWEELIYAQEADCNLEQKVIDFCDELNDKLYKMLQDEYEYLTSEEEFIGSCEANEITFEIEEEESCE
jgi:hypothetical protein